MQKGTWVTEDKINELPEALMSYLPDYFRRRQKDLTVLHSALNNHDDDQALEVTHNILGSARNYKLFQMELMIQDFENFIKNKQYSQAKDKLSDFERYLQDLIVKYC